MHVIDQAALILIGVAALAAVVGIPYLHFEGKRLDREMSKRKSAGHPAE